MGNIENKESTATNNTSATTPKTTTKKASKPKKISMDTLIPCKNATMGKLVYGSSKTVGYTIVWAEPNVIEPVEFHELLSMRNTAPKFFKKNWIVPVDDEYSAEDVLKQLNMLTYYKNFIDTEKLEEFFEKSVHEITDVASNLSDGQKDVVYFKAVELFKDAKLADLNKIRALERVLGKPIMD